MISALYASIAAIALVLLSMRVIRLRQQKGISIGSDGDADLRRARRVHGNFVEYTPLMLLLLILAEMQGLSVWAVHLFGLAILLSRLFHFLGIYRADAPFKMRVLGMTLTFACLVLLAAVLLVQTATRMI